MLEPYRRVAEGHLFTVAPLVAHLLRPPRLGPVDPWAMEIDDETVGGVRLTGLMSRTGSGSTALVVVHGLGGSATSHYAVAAAAAAERAGIPCLRINMRGADGSGDDFYHAGLTRDLHTALESPALERFDRIVLLGFSIGGHLVLRLATEELDPRVRAVAAICPPLDLAATGAEIDRPARYPYRRHILVGLKHMHAAMAKRGRSTVSTGDAAKISRVREWDRLIVAPRWGFESPEAYYAAAGVGSRLGLVHIPALLVAATEDPMVPARYVRPSLEGASPKLSVRWIARGGHVGFPSALDLGFDAPRGLESQVIHWLTERT